MSGDTKEFLNLLSQIPSELPRALVDDLITRLTDNSTSTFRGKLHRIASTPASRKLLKDLDEAWSKCSELSDVAIGSALSCAQFAEGRLSKALDVKIIWTGPATEVVPLRRTEQALKEIIDEATDSLLIVSFVTYKVDDIMDALKRLKIGGLCCEWSMKRKRKAEEKYRLIKSSAYVF